MGIAVFGPVFVDIKGYPFNTYIPGGRNAGRVEQVHGGVSRNIAEDIANLDLKPIFVSLVDNSGIGADVVHHLRERGVDTNYIRCVPDGLGTWLAVFDHTGDVVAAISKRPDVRPLLDTLSQSGDAIFAAADSISVEIDMDEDIVRRIFSLAERYNKRVYAVVSNMSIALERRKYIRSTDCFVCNQQEAGIFFSENYSDISPEELCAILPERVRSAGLARMVVTLGAHGAVYASADGEHGFCPAQKVNVKDTTGAGDAFFAGVTVGLTYGKTLGEACAIGTRLAASVVATLESVCPHFLPGEFGITPPIG